jgi:tetratricopeptide (TPR) repeat protein
MSSKLLNIIGRVLTGIAHAKKGDAKKAMLNYDQAIDLDPNCIEAYVSRGCLYANENKNKLAIEDLEFALTLDETHANAMDYLTKIKAKRRREKEIKKEGARRVINGEFMLPIEKT